MSEDEGSGKGGSAGQETMAVVADVGCCLMEVFAAFALFLVPVSLLFLNH